MKVLLIGSDARAHCIAWRLLKDDDSTEILAAPGNGGLKAIGPVEEISETDIKGQLRLVKKFQPDLIIPSSEEPLCLGLADFCRQKGFRVFGPPQIGALLEGSKSRAKQILSELRIPTAAYKTYTDFKAVVDAIQRGRHPYPVVIKVDGLAKGKGVFICHNFEEAVAVLTDIFLRRRFGEAGRMILIEDFLPGPEVSVIAVTDGSNLVPFLETRDYKLSQDGEKGVNTGGMGAYAPANSLTEKQRILTLEWTERVVRHFHRFVDRKYRGGIYLGIKITTEGLKVVEINCRFGNPETQVQVPLLGSNFLELLTLAADGDLGSYRARWRELKTVGVVMASEGYPGEVQTGYPIYCLEKKVPGTEVFHGGTAQSEGRNWRTNGGRVVTVVGIGKTFEIARNRAYERVKQINYHGRNYRHDIGLEVV